MIPEWGLRDERGNYLIRKIDMGLDDKKQRPYIPVVGAKPQNENATVIDLYHPSDRRDYVQGMIAYNHDVDDVLPDVIGEKVIHFPVELPGVVP